jgi:hypothetical protein
MNRDSIVQHVKARDKVIVWTASDTNFCWVYWPVEDRVDYVRMQDEPKSDIWVNGIVGMAALFPLFECCQHYLCRNCEDVHDSDETAEWLLIGHNSRDLTNGQFRQLPFRLRHSKRSNSSTPLRDSNRTLAGSMRAPAYTYPITSQNIELE